jgi:hypothetical protein
MGLFERYFLRLSIPPLELGGTGEGLVTMHDSTSKCGS